jgi:hypothetical protein
MSKKIYKKPLHGLDKVLDKHSAFCSVHIFSGDRHCSCGLNDAIEERKHMQELIDDYASSARAIHLWLKEFCNENLPYNQMISQAARDAAKYIEKMRKECS